MRWNSHTYHVTYEMPHRHYINQRNLVLILRQRGYYWLKVENPFTEKLRLISMLNVVNIVGLLIL